MTETQFGRSDFELRDGTTADGFYFQDLGAGNQDAPPAYGDLMNQLQLSQPGFEAGAAVTNDGRVDININESSRKFASWLAPALRSHLTAPHPGKPSPPPSPPPGGPLPPAYIPPSLGGRPGQTPPPRLNVVIQIVGSRGDVQPFVALGKVLKETYGHRVRLATHPTFQKFVEENGLEFFSIGGDPAELMAFMVKNPGLMPGFDAIKNGEITKRRKGIEEIVLGCWRSCIEAGDGLGAPPQPDRPGETLDEENPRLPGDPDDLPFVADAIIANPPSFAHIHIAEKLGIPLHVMFTMPWSPTRAFPHPLANIQHSNTDVVMTNYVSYAMVEMMTWQGLGDVINRFRTKVLDLEPLSLIWAPGLLTRLRVPTTYCWSPALIPKPADWGREVSIAGFFFLDLASAYTPAPDLAAFLAAGPPPVYIGFGSIVVDDPNHLTRTIFDAINIAGVRALVSKGWGGIGADSVGIPDGVFMLGNCPHDWLFQHVSCVVHHGGAGTSAAGIKLGRPTVVVPFFGDQPFWGAMIARAGAGPDPVPYKALTAESLAAAILEALKPETQARAAELGAKIREEKGADLGGKSFHDFLDMPAMRCSLAPSRVAVWRVRRTKVRLSALAAAVLVREGRIKYSDLKLYRSMEYNTEEQPWDPISAVTSAVIGDISDIGLAIADFPREIFKGSKRKETLPLDESHTQASSSTASLAVTDTRRSGPGPGSDAQQIHELATPDTRSDTASFSLMTRPSVTISAPDSVAATTDRSTAVTSPAAMTSPSLTPSREPRSLSESDHRGKSRSRSRASSSASASAAGLTLETATGAGKSVSRIVATGMKSPMNVCMGLARGFRNAPKLYNDDTVRPPEKVTDLASGLRVAGKEFGLGFYDGLSGLVTHPLRGAEREGGVGFMKGIGKGIGGLVLKPAAAVWSLPAYTMQGVHAELRNHFARSAHNYIVTSRVLQGLRDLDAATSGERRDIVARWAARGDDLKGYRSLKQKEMKEQLQKESPQQHAAAGGGDLRRGVSLDIERESEGVVAELAGETQDDEPPKTGWFHTRHLSFDERRKLQAQKEAWKRRQAERKGKAVVAPASVSVSAAVPAPAHTATTMTVDESEEFERAIRESVQQTSRGDADEDSRIEQAIRASVREMRRIAEQSREDRKERGGGQPPPPLPPRFDGSTEQLLLLQQQQYQQHAQQHQPPSIAAAAAAALDTGDAEDITDEEYQALIEEAVRQSLAHEHASAVAQGGREPATDEEEDEQLRRAIEESRSLYSNYEKRHYPLQQRQHSEQTVGVTGEGAVETAGAEATEDHSHSHDDEAMIQRALAESEREHAALRARAERDRAEEEIILEYVRKQSLAEEEFRRERRKQKMMAAGGGGDGGEGVEEDGDEENDEELRRALEESLRVTAGAGGGDRGGGFASSSRGG